MLKKNNVSGILLLVSLCSSSAFAVGPAQVSTLTVASKGYSAAVCDGKAVYHCCSITTHAHGSSNLVAFYPMDCSTSPQDGVNSGVGVAEDSCTKISEFVMQNQTITGSWVPVIPHPTDCKYISKSLPENPK